MSIWGFFMRKFLNISIFIFVTISLHAQKVMDKAWSSEGLESIDIRSDEVFNIFISNSDDEQITAVIKVEGETYENVVLEVDKKEASMVINTAYAPYFEPYNDKLAAHKVLAIEMHVKVPARLKVNVEAEIATVVATGTYKFLDLALDRGNGEVKDFQGNARVYTKEGFIKVKARNGTAGTAKSVRGKVVNELPSKGLFMVEAESISGDIWLLQTQ